MQVPKKVRSGPQGNLAPPNRRENPAPCKPVRKRTYDTRGTWSEKSMRFALDVVRSKRLSIRQTAELYGIPPSSIHDWKNGKTSTKKIGHQTYPTEVEELALVKWCFSMLKVALCVTLNMLKCTIQTILKNAPRQHPFRDGIPGQKWWDGFKKRHPSITLRCADGLEMKRALGLNRESTTFFYNLLEQVYSAHDFQPTHIWNADETGVSAGGGNSSIKVVAKKGSKSVRHNIVDDREWMNIMTCVNAAGSSIPNLYIFKTKTRPIIDYIRNCEPNAAMSWQENGYMTSEIFLDWLQHFKNNVPGGISRENKHLLVLDGHCSHVTREAVLFGLEIGLEILTLPAHSTHELQPLDVAIFHPFKLNLAQEKMEKMRKDPNWAKGSTMKTTLAEMASRALAKALKPESIKAGFSTTGLYPIDKRAMDLKLGADQVYVRNEVPEAEDEVASPDLQSPMPNFFSIEEDPQDITKSLSQLSLDEEELVILET